MTQPRVSVAMATYNGASYLREQLESIATQSRPPDELVVSDDGSTDETVALVKEFASRVPFGVSLHQRPAKLGYPQNFTEALQHCSGDFIFLCDQDDVWFPEKIHKVLNYFLNSPTAVLVIHDLEICRQDLSRIGQTKIGRLAMDTDVQRDYVTGAATALRGEFLRLCLPVPNLPGITHDTWLNRCALAVGGKLVVRDVLSFFRRHASNASAEMNPANSGRKVSRLDLLWMRFLRPPRFTALQGVPESPWARWLSSKGKDLQAQGYLDETQIEHLIARENARTNFMLRRIQILSYPRWRRWLPLLKLYRAGGYEQFSSSKSALKDAVVAPLPADSLAAA